jgi:hypothetical protein
MIVHIFHILHLFYHPEKGVHDEGENKGTKKYRKPFGGVIGEMEDMEDMEDPKKSKTSRRLMS